GRSPRWSFAAHGANAQGIRAVDGGGPRRRGYFGAVSPPWRYVRQGLIIRDISRRLSVKTVLTALIRLQANHHRQYQATASSDLVCRRMTCLFNQVPPEPVQRLPAPVPAPCRQCGCAL